MVLLWYYRKDVFPSLLLVLGLMQEQRLLWHALELKKSDNGYSPEGSKTVDGASEFPRLSGSDD